MTLSDSVKSCINKYATMEGRAPRSEYWWFVLFVFLFTLVAEIIFAAIGAALGGVVGAMAAYSVGVIIIYLGLLIPQFCLTVRRLHDTGHGGQWIFIVLVPIIGSIWLLVLMLQDSDEENRFGLPVY